MSVVDGQAKKPSRFVIDVGDLILIHHHRHSLSPSALSNAAHVLQGSPPYTLYTSDISTLNDSRAESGETSANKTALRPSNVIAAPTLLPPASSASQPPPLSSKQFPSQAQRDLEWLILQQVR